MESNNSFQQLRYIFILILFQVLTIVFAIAVLFSLNLHICEDPNNNSIEVPKGKLLHVPMFGKLTISSRNRLLSKPTHAILHYNHFFQPQKIANLIHNSTEERLQIPRKQVKPFYLWLQKYIQHFNEHYNIFFQKGKYCLFGCSF